MSMYIYAAVVIIPSKTLANRKEMHIDFLLVEKHTMT